MTLLKAANSPGSATHSYAFTRPQHRESEDRPNKPIEAKTTVSTGPARDTNLAKEEHFLDQIAALEKALTEKDKAIESAKAVGFEEGAKAGQKAAATQSEEALDLLKTSLADGSTTLKEQLEGKVDLALDLARTILRRILGEDHEMPTHVIGTARHWKQELAEGSVLRVRVCADDFPDQAALDGLQAELPNIEIIPQPGLKPGACQFDLKLGTLDASIDSQLSKAEGFLAETLHPAKAR